MDIQSEKLELIKMLLETDDKDIIESIKNIFKSQKKDVWKELSPEQQEEIDLGIQEANRGDKVDL
jgi:Mg/Co/Ni transporter MgtE